LEHHRTFSPAIGIGDAQKTRSRYIVGSTNPQSAFLELEALLLQSRLQCSYPVSLP